jgi:hypothetical protein
MAEFLPHLVALLRCYDFKNIFAKKTAFSTQNKANFGKNLDHNIGF